MQFDAHITHICKKSVGTIMCINRIKDNFSKKARIMVLQSLVLSIINYGIIIWGNTSQTQLQRVQKIQNFAAKVALGSIKFDYVTPYLQGMKWLKIKDKYLYELALNIFNIITKNVPSWLFYLPTSREMCAVNTRQQHHLHVPKTNTCTAERSFLVSGPKLWNSLPNDIRNKASSSSFKTQLRGYLLQS